jgi:4-hydroxy-2-oxoglutarate aldolase
MTSIVLSGIYPPLPTFFDTQEELDLDTYQRHISRMAEHGITGYVVMGSNGEAVHLSSDERAQVIEAARQAAGSAALIIAGCGEQSTRATMRNCEQAARSGADVVLVLPPFYYKGRMDSTALLAHYRSVADRSPLPLVIYNMPANTAGLDLDVATICALAEHPNIIGVKDSAGNMAKLAQIVARTPAHFRVFAGSAGYLLPALVTGAVGAVAALANIFPREVCRVQELFNAGHLKEARLLQANLAPANTAVTTTYNVPGLKAALELTAGYGGRPRSPLHPLTEQERIQLANILDHVNQPSGR